MGFFFAISGSVPYIIVGVIGLALAPRYAPAPRVLALCGSALVVLYGLVWLGYTFVWVELLELGRQPPVWQIFEYGSLAILLGGLIVLGIAVVRRDRAPVGGATGMYAPPAPQPGYGPPAGPPAAPPRYPQYPPGNGA